MFVHLLFTAEKTLHEGLAYIVQDNKGSRISMEEDTPTDMGTPVTTLMSIKELILTLIFYQATIKFL